VHNSDVRVAFWAGEGVSRVGNGIDPGS
jgi:hypothetical protein